MLTSTKIKAENWDLLVWFNDGSVKKIDIRLWLKGYEQAEAKKIIQEIDYFHKAINEGAAITWPGGFSIDPDYIHEEGETIKRKIDWKKVIRADLDRRKSLNTSPLIKN
jgi:hypothetical protein